MKIQTPHQFYTDLFMKVPSDRLMKLLAINNMQVSKEEIIQAVTAAENNGYEDAVRRLFVRRMLTFPLREVCIRFAWPYDFRGLNRLQHIPSRTAKDIAVKPRIDHDRWLVDCPYCPGAEMAMDKFFCVSCLNSGIWIGGPEKYEGDLIPVGLVWIPVEWPPNSERFQREEDYVGGVENLQQEEEPVGGDE